MQHFTLAHTRSLGDIVVMTSLVRDIHLAFPGRYQTSVYTPFREVWQNNPYIISSANRPDATWLPLSYGADIYRAGREPVHFLQAWHRDFQRRTNIEVPLLHPKPDLHLSEEEMVRPLSERYWVVIAGGKTDFTTKHWLYHRHQEVVDTLGGLGLTVVQMGAVGKEHRHPKLRGVVDRVGDTSVREMMRYIYHSEGVICTITAAMHIAAAFDKPCVVTAGGREEWHWEGYTNETRHFGEAAGPVKVPHRFLHTMGLLDCCAQKGCWKNKVHIQEEDSRKSYCHRPTKVKGQNIPECMAMITTDHVVSAVLSYYFDGTLEPTTDMRSHMSNPIGPKGCVFSVPGGSARLTLELLQEEQPKPELPVATVKAAPIPTKFTPLPVPAPIPTKPKNPVAAITTATNPNKVSFDEVRVGGKFTIFVLMYGAYYEMHKRCLDAILETCPAERIDLRIGSNELCDKSVEMIDAHVQAGRVRRHYRHKENLKKYPVMREMFHDPDLPIETKWIIWFDDDSMCDKNKDWLNILSRDIAAHPEADMFGPLRILALRDDQPDWIRRAPWYKNKFFRDKNGSPTPNGDKVLFAVGAFWALRTDAMRKSDIPCARLGHNGGDWTIGEQLWQAGFRLKNWSSNKNIIDWSCHPRRGYRERHPGIRG